MTKIDELLTNYTQTTIMYGCADPYVIYGFKEPERKNIIIDFKWLSEYGVDIFAEFLVAGSAFQPIYGIKVDFDKNTGQSTIGDGKKVLVDKLATILHASNPKFMPVIESWNWDGYITYYPVV